MLLAFLGKLYLDFNNAIVFCNFTPNYKHIKVTSLEDFKTIKTYDKDRVKVCLIDDAERIIFSRFSNKELNIEFLNECLLDWGKISCSAYFDLKRELAIDIGIREECNEFWQLEQQLKVKSNTGNLDLDHMNNNILKKYLNFLRIKVYRIDSQLKELPPYYFNDMVYMSRLFDTQEFIKTLYQKRNQNKEVRWYG